MLAPNAVEEIGKYNPTIYNANTKMYDRKYRMYRHLTEDGIKELREHLKQLVTVMKLSKDIDDFKTNFENVFADRIKTLTQLKLQLINNQ